MAETTDRGTTTTETRTLDGDGRLQSAELAGDDVAKSGAYAGGKLDGLADDAAGISEKVGDFFSGLF